GCAIALPEVVEYAAKTEWKKVEMICECLGAEIKEDATPEDIGTVAKNALRSLIKSVGIPNLKELGIQLEDALRIAPLITQDTGFALIPYRITATKVAEMLKSAYEA
ncbi:MAG: alcohol dehydrogenase, class, partial [Sedimentibacter sp.]|nr:alcohol dehydrogenase, class [Sedimentibacter sp.]